jgi:hypothetical protein
VLSTWSKIFLVCILATITVKICWAHGEPVRGIGAATINTVGAEISSGIGVGIRYDRRAYKLFSNAELLKFQGQGENVHQHAVEETIFLGASFGITPNIDLSVQLPLGRFSNFKDNGDSFALANNTISATDVSQGVGDLLVMGRYRFFQREDQNIAVIAGIKLPSGNTNQKTNVGEIVGTHNQPGSGSTDFIFGLGYSAYYFRDMLGVSADALARINTDGANEFRSGNSVLLNLALSYKPHNRLVPILEFNFITQDRDNENNAVKRNSGVTSLFITLGSRLRITENNSVLAAFAFPAIQNLPGIQNKETYRINVGWSYGFQI